MRTWLNEVTASLWGRAARAQLESDAWKLLSWDQHPVTQRHISRRVTGDPGGYWLDFVHRRFVPSGTDYGLSLACGSGVVERHAVRTGMCRAMDACDISAEALAVAGQLARQEGLAERIRYFVADLNTDRLERDKYEICFSSAAIHHVANLDHAFAEIRAALRPDGLLVLMEYMGPSRFQWSDKVQALMNAILDVLPEPHRTSLTTPGVVRGNLQRPSPEEVAAADPSEAVRSGEILEQLQRSFDVVYRADYGGTLLQFALAEIIGNFAAEDPRDRALLELIILFEDTLIAEGVIPSDFVMLVARPRASCRPASAGGVPLQKAEQAIARDDLIARSAHPSGTSR